MQSLKSGFGVISALLPVVYFGGLLFYFYDQAGSLKGADDLGLSPTLLGLGVVGLLFCIPLIYRILKIFNGPRSPRSDGGPNAPPRDDDERGFDADAVVARYMAKRSAEATPGPTAARPTRGTGAPAKPSGFGRKTR